MASYLNHTVGTPIKSSSSKTDAEWVRSVIRGTDKENIGVKPVRFPSSDQLDGLHDRSVPTPTKSTFGRIVDLFSPIKSGYSSEAVSDQSSCEGSNQDLQRMQNELLLQRESFEAEKRTLINSHRHSIRSLEEQLASAQQSISDLNRQLDAERRTVQNLSDYVNQTEHLISWCKDQLDIERELRCALQSASDTIDTIIAKSNRRIWKLGFGADTSLNDSIHHDRILSLLDGAQSEISDLKYNIFELEANLEQEQDQAADYQQCIQTMEDEVLELQVQRDQAIDELKKTPSIPDLELARAEAELIATECMFELARAGDIVEAATDRLISANQRLRVVNSDIQAVTAYAETLESQVADLIQESDLWRKRDQERENQRQREIGFFIQHNRPTRK